MCLAASGGHHLHLVLRKREGCSAGCLIVPASAASRRAWSAVAWAAATLLRSAPISQPNGARLLTGTIRAFARTAAAHSTLLGQARRTRFRSGLELAELGFVSGLSRLIQSLRACPTENADGGRIGGGDDQPCLTDDAGGHFVDLCEAGPQGAAAAADDYARAGHRSCGA